MPKTQPSLNDKIGLAIKKARQQSRLTQAELGRRLKMSQSAINQIERGQRSLNLTTISRFSHILKQPIIGIQEPRINLRVRGQRRLGGSLTIGPAKNSIVALLMASLLNRGPTVLQGLSQIEESNRLIEVLKSLGVSVKWRNQTDLEIKRPHKLNFKSINSQSAQKTRSAILLIGALAAEKKPIKLPSTGGCRLGDRSNIAHRLGLAEFGLNVNSIDDDWQQIDGTFKPASTPIILCESSDTATVNILLAAVQTPAETVIRHASANYQVTDLCLFLRRLGAEIKGIGTTTLRVKGWAEPPQKLITYTPVEDPIEAMTFLAAAIATDSAIELKRVPIEYIELELVWLKQMGVRFTKTAEYVGSNQLTRLTDLKVKRHRGKLVAPTNKIAARPFPGLNIDNLPYFVPIAASATGTTLIHDWVYENRAVYYLDLNNLGATIQLADPHRVFVRGPTRWQATDMICPPALRPASINLIGMMAADGVSTLRNIYTINRGYDKMADRLISLGADIEIIYDIFEY